MGVLSSELSSWRKHLVECRAGIVNTLNFRDTRPNVMLVMNPSNAKVMSCLDSIPTEKNYDFMIKNHYARLVGRPTPTSQVYFLSDYDVTLQVYSIYDKNFDPSWLSDFSIDNVNIESESLQPLLDALKAQSKTEIAGVKDGVILPTQDTELNRQVSNFFVGRTFNELLAPSGIPNTTNLKTIVAKLSEIYGQLTGNNAINLPSLYQALMTLTSDNSITLGSLYQTLMTLTAGGNKGITDIIGSDGTSLTDLNNTLLECKTLLADIKTNTTK